MNPLDSRYLVQLSLIITVDLPGLIVDNGQGLRALAVQRAGTLVDMWNSAQQMLVQADNPSLDTSFSATADRLLRLLAGHHGFFSGTGTTFKYMAATKNKPAGWVLTCETGTITYVASGTNSTSSTAIVRVVPGLSTIDPLDTILLVDHSRRADRFALAAIARAYSTL